MSEAKKREPVGNQMRDILIAFYYEYVNNFLTMVGFAEHHGLSVEDAMNLYLMGKRFSEEKHPDE